MNKNTERSLFPILISFVFLWFFLFSRGIEAAGTFEESIKPGKEKTGKMAGLELPIPPNDRDRAYLGLEGSGTFKLNQIKTRILIIEILNTYCPHCQHSAPLVNTLYDHIQERADLKDKIKIIGIGIGDNRDEINLFKQDYRVTFPLIPDQDGDIGNIFGVEATPTFIGIRLNDQGLPEKFFFQEGGFRKAPRFLKEIIRQAGLKWEE